MGWGLVGWEPWWDEGGGGRVWWFVPRLSLPPPHPNSDFIPNSITCPNPVNCPNPPNPPNPIPNPTLERGQGVRRAGAVPDLLQHPTPQAQHSTGAHVPHVQEQVPLRLPSEVVQDLAQGQVPAMPTAVRRVSVSASVGLQRGASCVLLSSRPRDVTAGGAERPKTKRFGSRFGCNRGIADALVEMPLHAPVVLSPALRNAATSLPVTDNRHKFHPSEVSQLLSTSE